MTQEPRTDRYASTLSILNYGSIASPRAEQLRHNLSSRALSTLNYDRRLANQLSAVLLALPFQQDGLIFVQDPLHGDNKLLGSISATHVHPIVMIIQFWSELAAWEISSLLEYVTALRAPVGSPPRSSFPSKPLRQFFHRWTFIVAFANKLWRDFLRGETWDAQRFHTQTRAKTS